MKIFNSVVINIETGVIVGEDSFEYFGPVFHLKGGGGTSTTTVQGEIDYEYNARMAEVAERQVDMAEEYMSFWRTHYQPMEIEQIGANRQVIPFQTQTEIARNVAETELLPYATEYKKGLYDAGIAETREARPVMSEYYKSALRGIDVDQRVNQARADVASTFSDAGSALRRDIGRLGISPDSSRFFNLNADQRMEQAKATATAMTGARTTAEDVNFARLSEAARTFKGGILS